MTTLQRPPGWAHDELTKFLDDARNNQWGTFWNKRAETERLVAIDTLFARISKDWTNPQHPIPALLLLRSHAAFRAATGLAMSGQVAETFPVCRTMLECAAYAVHICEDPARGVVWLNRHQDKASMATQREAFQHGKVLASVTAANRGAGQRFAEGYQHTIDFGGHPNHYAVFANMTMVELSFRQIMLHEDGLQLDHALKTVARCGMVSLEMLEVVFHARFEILGVSSAMLTLRDGL